MASFKIEYNSDGLKTTTLNFRGEDYILRMTPFEDGVSHGLDKEIWEQVEEVLKKNNEDEDDIEQIADIIYEIENDGFDIESSLEELKDFE